MSILIVVKVKEQVNNEFDLEGIKLVARFRLVFPSLQPNFVLLFLQYLFLVFLNNFIFL